MAGLLYSLLAAGWLIVAVLPFQLRRSWGLPLVPFAITRLWDERHPFQLERDWAAA